MKWILVLWCLFVVGDWVYVIGADPEIKAEVKEVYVSKQGNCVYRIVAPEIEYWSGGGSERSDNFFWTEKNVEMYWQQERLMGEKEWKINMQ